jgi:hypothetical protein
MFRPVVGAVVGQAFSGVPLLGPELVLNGEFASGLTSWTFAGTSNTASVVDGVLQLPTGESRVQGVPVAVGRLYAVQAVGDAKMYLGTSSNGNQYASSMLGAGNPLGVSRRYIRATAATLWIALQNDAGATRTADNVSVREVPHL